MWKTKLALIIFGSLIFAAQFPRQNIPYFEGTFTYSVEMEGPAIQFMEENKPNNKMIMHFKDHDYIIQLMGGQYPKTLMYINDSNFEYVVDAQNQKAYRYSPFSDRNKDTNRLQLKMTDKKAIVKEVECKIILARTKEAMFAYYVNDDYRVDTQGFIEDSRSKASFLIPELAGRIPLKTIKRQKGLTVTTTVTEIKRRPFKKAQFMIPSSFRVLNRDYRF